MHFDEYQEKAVGTAIYGAGCKVVYPALGMANEAGEALGKIKKVLRDNDGKFTPELNKAIADEIGDTLWYMAALLKDLDINFDTVAQNNIKKLEDRQKRGVIGGSGDNR